MKFFLPAIKKDIKTIKKSFDPEKVIRFEDVVFFVDSEGKEIYSMSSFVDRNNQNFMSRVFKSKDKIMLF